MENLWKFKGTELQDADIPPKAIGFVYCITQISNGKKYIGRKLLTAAATKTVAGVKKKYRKESDWKDYWSSSPWLQAYIEEHGTADFSKEILVFCFGKAELNYAEEKIQYSLGVLETDNFLNDNIRSKQYRKWAKNYKNLKELNSAILDLHLQNHLFLQNQALLHKTDTTLQDQSNPT